MEGNPFWCVLRGDPPVIHIIAQILWILLKELPEVSVHHPLEEGRHVHQAKIHDLRDKSPVFCLERRLVLIFFCNSDVVVSPAYVKF